MNFIPENFNLISQAKENCIKIGLGQKAKKFTKVIFSYK